MNYKSKSLILRMSMCFMIMCIFMFFIVDRNSAEEVVLTLSCIMNLVLIILVRLSIKKEIKKDEAK